MNTSQVFSNEEIRRRITTVYSLLVSDLDADRLSDYLIERGIITAHQWHEIKNKNVTKHERCRELLSVLMRMTNPSVWTTLWKILTQNEEWTWIVEEIKRRTTDPISNNFEEVAASKEYDTRSREIEDYKNRLKKQGQELIEMKSKLCKITKESQDRLILIKQKDEIIANLNQEIRRKDSEMKEREETSVKLEAENKHLIKTCREMERNEILLKQRDHEISEMNKKLSAVNKTSTDREIDIGQQTKTVANLRQTIEQKDLKIKEKEEKPATLVTEHTHLPEKCKELRAKFEDLELHSTLAGHTRLTSCSQKSRKNRPTREERESLRQETQIQNEGDELWSSAPRLVQTVKVGSKTAISGVDIVDQELFIANCELPGIKVYDLSSLRLRRNFVPCGLKNLYDLASCKVTSCLYVMQAIADTCKIIQSDTNGKILNSWSTGSTYGCISVTFDLNIVVTSREENMILEYTQKGDMIRKINLSEEAGMVYPTYAVKQQGDRFLVSHGGLGDELNRICVIDFKGDVKAKFGDKDGSDNDSLDFPGRMAIDSTGSIIVADRNNNRLLLLDSKLKFKRVLIPRETEGMRGPRRFAVDESTGRLFVLCHNSYEDESHLFVFKFG